MATDTERMVAAALAAALLQPAQSLGDVGGLDRAQSLAAKRAAALYKEILTAIEEPVH